MKAEDEVFDKLKGAFAVRNVGCEGCEAQVRHLTRSRSLTVREREALWHAISVECAISECPVKCSTRALISRVSSNLTGFVEKLDRQQQEPVPDALKE